MASKVWAEVYGLPGGYDKRARVNAGITDEGNGNSAEHFLESTGLIPVSLDADGMKDAAGKGGEISIRSRGYNAEGETNGSNAREKAKGEAAVAKITALFKTVRESVPVAPTEGELSPEEAASNGRTRVMA